MTNDTLAELAADNLPDRIYLVLGEEIGPDDDPRADFDELGEVTWCIDRQFENDVEYVRADLAALTAQALPAAEPVAWQSRFTANNEWSDCTKDHHDWVKRAPQDFPGYEARELFATPQAAQQAAQASAGWVPSEAKKLLRAGLACHALGYVSVNAVQRHLAIDWNLAQALCLKLIELRLVDGLDATSPHLAAALPQPQPQSAQTKGDA